MKPYAQLAEEMRRHRLRTLRRAGWFDDRPSFEWEMEWSYHDDGFVVSWQTACRLDWPNRVTLIRGLMKAQMAGRVIYLPSKPFDPDDDPGLALPLAA